MVTDMPSVPPDYERRLDTLEQQGIDSKTRLMHVERSVEIVGRQVEGLNNKLDTQVGGLNTKLDTVVTAVTTVTAQPKWDFIKILDIATKGVILFVAVAGGITYIATNINAVHNVRNEMRAEFLQQRIDNGWLSKGSMMIRAPGGSVTPQ
jgi:hypothetical protein